MKYRPKQCPKCSHNRNKGAWCAAGAYNNRELKGESQRNCYDFLPEKLDAAQAGGK